ncbi:MAG: hypothetical protein Rubg2KO_21460 [Rubricoccaceae bacterium]
MFALSLVALPSLAYAQDGRLAGTITDASTGDPIPGATVILEGTTFGAATNIDGQYSVIGIDPATYDVRISYIGYTTQIIEGVLVTADRTTSLDAELSTSVIEGGEVTVQAEEPVVDPNQTTSRTLVTGEELATLPASDLNDVISTTANSYSGFLRGSRRFETKTIIEGIDVSDAFYQVVPTPNNVGGYSGLTYNSTNKSSQTNSSLFSINPDVVSQVSVNTGATAASYASGSGGVVAISLAEGKGPISGSFSARFAPSIGQPGPDSLAFYPSLQATQYAELRQQLLSTPETSARGNLLTWTPDKYTVGGEPEADVRFNVGGSITDDWSINVSTQWFQTNGFQPNEFRRRVGGTLKSSYNIGNSSRITALAIVEDQGLWGGWNNRSYHDNWRYYLEGVAQDDGGSYLGSLKFTQVFSESSFLDVQVYRTFKQNRYGYVDDDGNGFTDLGEDGDFLDFNDPEVIAKYVGEGTDLLMFATNVDAFARIDAFNTSGNIGVRAAQPVPYYEDALNSVNGARLDYSNQLTPNHFLQGGAELKLRHFEYEQIYGIDGNGAKLNGTDADGEILEPFVPSSYTRNPYELALYASDRIEYGGLIVNAGLRVEFIDRDMEKIEDFFYPFQRDSVVVAGRTLYRNAFRRGDSVPMDVFLNPRIGVSHPIGTNAAMYFSYARNTQLAPYTQLYNRYDGNNSNNVFFSYQDPEQDPISSNNYELGIQWEFAEGWGADVNAYLKSISNYGRAGFTADNRVPEDATDGTLVGNVHRWSTSFGYAESRGIELVLRRRPLSLGNGITLGLTSSYTYSTVESARGSGSTSTSFADNDPDNPITQLPFEIADQIENFPQNVQGGLSTLTGGYDRRHRVVVRSVLDLPFDASIGLRSTYESGFLYAKQIGVDNRARDLVTGPSNFQADLRLEKQIPFGSRLGLDLYVDVVNLTGQQNIIAYNRNELSSEAEVFERTGNPGSRLIQRDGSALYGTARNLYFGARVRF